MKKNILIALIMLLGGMLHAQPISIDSARTLGADSTVTITGIVTNGPELGTIRYMQDSTAGIAIYDYSFSQYASRGYSVTVTGTLKEYNNLLEMDPVNNFTIDSSAHTLPAPQVITPGQLNETVEGERVRINNATFSGAGSTFSSNTSYTFTANGNTAEIYVRSNHPLIGQVIPSNPVDLIGLGSQYSYSNPNTGYQLILRDGNDIIATSAINLTSEVSISNISTTGFDLNWTTDTTGSTEIFYGNTPQLEKGKMTSVGPDTSQHQISITGASPSEVFYVEAFSVQDGDTASSGVETYITQSNSSGDMEAYFTTEVDTGYSTGKKAKQLDDAIDDTLIAYLNRAQKSIDFAIYHLNNNNISNITAALNNAHNRGVDVRVVYDSGIAGSTMQNLDPGIGAIASSTGAQYGIMHNKFVVIDAKSSDPDDPLVWTGATNFTEGQINDDDNNVIIIQDKSLAKTYRLEFNEMFGSDGNQPDMTKAKFGPEKTDNTPHEFIIGGKNVECYFSPSDNTNDKIIETIKDADHNLNIATMLITRSDIGYAIEDAINQGVKTKIMINNTSQSNSSLVSTLQNKLGNDFRNNDNGNNIMHHKYMFVDEVTNSDPVLLTGSHNWSYSANDVNDENTLIIHDDTMANVYKQEFMKFFTDTTCVDENSHGSHINAWPNPASERINVKFNHSKEAFVNLYNMNGQRICNFQTDKGTNTIHIDELKSGLYLLELISDNHVGRKKIIVE